jgi:hypothetical protein
MRYRRVVAGVRSKNTRNSLPRAARFKGGALGLAALAVLAPAVSQSAELGMLDALTKGQWTLRTREEATPLRVCVRTGRELIQLRHTQSGCSRFVVEDGPNEVVVQYTCPGNGYGRTSIRRESNNLVQIQSQGIDNGAPFSFSGEARHTGRC